MKNMKWFLIIVSALVSAGCATQYSWVYSANNYKPVNTKSDKSVAVLPFKDGRSNENSTKIFLYLIPLVPFGPADYDVPEGAQKHINSGLWTNYKPVEDFPKALAEELRSANLFKEAYFDFKKGGSDYVINGTILSTKYSGKIISYGLSAYGPILWLIGLPASSISNELSLELVLLDSKTDKILFTKRYTTEPYEKVGWIYSLPSDFYYPEMLKKAYKEFVTDIANNSILENTSK